MLDFLKSTVGRKYIMGLTGLVWVGFVIAHMAGNLLIFAGPDLYNSYGHALVSNKLILYGAESVLVLALLTHVTMAILLTRQNRSARGTNYAVAAKGLKAPKTGSSWMGVQGSVLLAFIILHLITFKYGSHYDTTVNGVVMRDLHKLIIEVFHKPEYVFGYVIALALMMFHLSHGAASVFQSFGILERKLQDGIKKCAWAYSVIVTVGFLSQPLYVFLFHK